MCVPKRHDSGMDSARFVSLLTTASGAFLDRNCSPIRIGSYARMPKNGTPNAHLRRMLWGLQA